MRAFLLQFDHRHRHDFKTSNESLTTVVSRGRSSPEAQARLSVGLEQACVRHPAAHILPLWRDLLSRRLDFREVLERFRRAPGLTYLTVDTTGVCDLTCLGMCYYHPDINVRQAPVTEEALQAAVGAAYAELGMKNLVFAGKEPLQNAGRLIRLARFAGDLPRRDFGIGVVTNGRGIAKHWSELDALAHDGLLTFLDISIDSAIAAQHDAIRGVPGTFERAWAALERCAHEWPQVRVGTASVLREDNSEGIRQLLRRAALFNRHFFITPIQPPPFTATPPLVWTHIRDFLRALLQLLKTDLCGAGLEVMVSLLGLYLWDAEADGFFQWDELCEDAQGQVHIERKVGGNRFILHMQVLPETGWRVGRITYNGAYLPNTHFVQHAQPERFAVGYIQEEPLPVLYRRALSPDGVLGRMLESRNDHSCRGRPCWSCCFGGLAAAEHSFVGGAPINRQPALCLKTNTDFISGSA